MLIYLICINEGCNKNRQMHKLEESKLKMDDIVFSLLSPTVLPVLLFHSYDVFYVVVYANHSQMSLSRQEH